MKKYVPIVTDDPQDNVEAALNLVFIKDEEVYVRGYGPAPDFSDATLSNVTRDILQKYSPETLENVRLKDDLELSCATSEWLFDGIDTIEGVVALLYTMAWAFAETRERLRMYEETRLSPMDLKDRLIAPFQNDMFAMVWGAFKKLYPGVRVPIHHEGVKKMNRNLNEAIFDIAKVEAIMFAFENTYLELDVAPADRARADMATDAFYALWDAIRKVSDDLDRLAGDCRVVDAIYAVNDVRRRVGTLKTED